MLWLLVQGMRMGEFVRRVLLVCSALVAVGQDGPSQPVAPPENAAKPPVIVVGFMGGFVAHDNKVHSGVQLAARLRGNGYPTQSGRHFVLRKRHL